ncbi:MAG: ethanolamine ammonia-lyase reactivating factor EutA [Oscillospiraceae bacterium]|jgi:ethanolamine utilization protein EutA|nr:ethanolamine ammonia-lyase reactivating factor EutA [Oscillospiraceae bacterium]
MPRQELRSVGIDVGTSTTQVIFSALRVENTAGFASAPSAAITEKRVTYRGESHETPLIDASRIDAEQLRALVAGEFGRAGVAPGDVDTGAVIITGESARKENAAAVLASLSGFAGEFVVSTAGPDLEARMAGQGSGAQAASKARHCRVANLDIGGGTTNIAIFDSGALEAVGCYDIGGRQLRFTPAGQITYISGSAAKIAGAVGLHMRVGDTPALDGLRSLARAMAQLLGDSVAPGGMSPLLASVKTAGSSGLNLAGPVDFVSYSGGVADCIYKTGHERFAFGDFGVLLGEAVRAGADFTRVLTPAQTIRATVIGAGLHIVRLSGSTVRCADASLFPLKNLPVFCPARELLEDPAALTERFAWFLRQNDAPNAVLFLEGGPSPGYMALKALAESMAEALDAALPPGEPILALAYHDIGKALGQLMAPRAPGRAVVSLDGLRAGPNDFLDLGRPVMDGLAVPVVIKTLVFG